MTGIKVKTLIWNDFNIEHIKKHKVTKKEVEIAISNITYYEKADKDRYKAVGRSGKRILSVIINRDEKTTYYVVTARDSSKKEKQKLYDKEHL